MWFRFVETGQRRWVHDSTPTTTPTALVMGTRKGSDWAEAARRNLKSSLTAMQESTRASQSEPASGQGRSAARCAVWMTSTPWRRGALTYSQANGPRLQLLLHVASSTRAPKRLGIKQVLRRPWSCNTYSNAMPQGSRSRSPRPILDLASRVTQLSLAHYIQPERAPETLSTARLVQDCRFPIRISPRLFRP
jgi:hypothetical protein